MQSNFVLTVAGIEPAELNRRAISLSWTDQADGSAADSLRITLDDADARLAIPNKGAKISARLGYGQRLQELPEFVVDEVQLTGRPRQMVIVARSANLRDRFKTVKTRSWDNVRLGDLVAEIAADNDLKPAISGALAGYQFEHLDQTNESDLNLLTRLALELHAVAKPVGDRLLFVPAGEARSASGKSLPEVPVAADACDNGWNVTLPDRNSFSGVEARWHDPISAAEVSELAGDRSGAVAALPLKYSGRAEAEAAAAARLQFLQRQGGKITFTIDGDPKLRAETPLRLSGFHSQVDGVWPTQKAVHRAGKNQRYTTQVEAAPKAGA
ncbi:hypothetical protein [Microbulbifer sp. PSTR4-B]|uniref:hypothetical protein n=1 Tax=unclassified Microbulbifer TaxID=2619833 RepID=UPI00403B33F7